MNITFKEEINKTILLLREYKSIYYFGYIQNSTFTFSTFMSLSKTQEELLTLFFNKNVKERDTFYACFSNVDLEQKIIDAYFEIK